MSRFLTPVDFGLVSISFMLVYSIKLILVDNITTAIVRKSDATDAEYSTVFWVAAGLGLLSAGAFEAFSFVADAAFRAPGLGEVMRPMGAILLVLAVVRTQEAWLIRHFHFQVLALRSILAAVFGGACGVALAIMHFGVWSLVIQQGVTFSASLALLWFKCPWRPSFTFSRRTAAEIMGFMRAMSGVGVLNVLNQNCDILVVGLFFGPASAGIYSVGKRLRLALQLVAASPVNTVAMPALAEAQHEPARLRGVTLTLVGLVFAICCPVFVGASVVSNDAITIVFGPNWEASAPVFAWLALGGLCQVIIDQNCSVLLVCSRQKWVAYNAALYTALVLLCFPLAARLGLHSMAIPFVLPYAVTLPLSLELVRRTAGLTVTRLASAILPQAAAALLMFVGVRLIDAMLPSMAVIPHLGIEVAAGGVIYAIVMAAVGRRMLADARRVLFRRRADGALDGAR